MDTGSQISYLREYLPTILRSLPQISPEVILATGIILVLGLDLLKFRSKSTIQAIVFLAILLFSAIQLGFMWNKEPQQVFNEILQVTRISLLLKSTFIVALVFTKVMEGFESGQKTRVGERDALYLSMILGANFMVMANHYLIMFLGIELVSISSYILVGFGDSKHSYEASIKYLLFGAMSTAIFLYGTSLAYGITTSLYFTQLPAVDGLLGLLIIVFISSALFFKLGAAPMHLWVPDVYEATRMPLLALLSFVPKMAAIGLLYHWLSVAELLLYPGVQILLIIVSTLSIIIGTLSAMWQEVPSRLMGFSTIANAGFLLIGLIAGTTFGMAASVFYGIIYLFMNYLAFHVIQGFEKKGVVTIKEYAGLFSAAPGLAVMFLIAMISLTGLPPTAGFSGKLFLFSALYEAANNMWVWLLFGVAIISTLISLYFYLKIPYQMIFKTQPTEVPSIFGREQLFATILALPLFICFIKSDFLFNFIFDLLAKP